MWASSLNLSGRIVYNFLYLINVLYIWLGVGRSCLLLVVDVHLGWAFVAGLRGHLPVPGQCISNIYICLCMCVGVYINVYISIYTFVCIRIHAYIFCCFILTFSCGCMPGNACYSYLTSMHPLPSQY